MSEQALKDRPYTIWIEAECWSPEAWNYDDGNTDVLVTFAEDEKWSDSFFTYTNIRTLTEKNWRTGECLAGKYFWAVEMILIDSISRASIEEVIRYLLDHDEFTTSFVCCVEPKDNLLDWSDGDPIFERFIENARQEGRLIEQPFDELPASKIAQ